MPPRHRSTRFSQSVSLFGFLAVAGGGGLLFSYFSYGHLWHNADASLKAAYIVLSCILVLWGVLQIAGSRHEKGVRGSRGRFDTDASAGEAPRPGVKRISRSGLLLVMFGLQAEIAAASFSLGRTLMWAIAAAGGVMLLLGGRLIYLSLVPPRQRPRKRIALPVPGAFYLVIMFVTLLASMIGGSNMMLLVFCLMTGPYVVNGWFINSMLRRTRVRRVAPKAIMAGEPASVEVVFENRKRYFSSWLIHVTDFITNSRESLNAGVLFARVRPRSSQSGHYRLRLMQRGWYHLGPIRVITRFPLGLVERGLIFDEHSRILVYPRVGKLLPAWNRDSIISPNLVHRRDPRPGAFDDEFHRIREYHSGDNPRAIHWRTSARHNELMVREFYPTRDRNLVVLLDLFVPPRPRDEDLERVELAVSFAASVCVDHMRQSRNSLVYVHAAGRKVTGWEGAAGPGGIESLLEMLAQVEAGSRPETGRLWSDSEPHRTGVARCVLITTRKLPEGVHSSIDLQNGFDSETAAGADVMVLRATPEDLMPYYQLV